MAGAELDISAVVCTHNGAQRLPDVLSRLRRQSLDPARYEVIVVDDGSDDGSAAMAESYGARVVRLNPRRGVGAARNVGAASAGAPVVAFTDDDCEPAEDWLETLLSVFRRQSVDGVGGHVVPRCENSFLLRYLEARNPVAPLGIEHLTATTAVARLGRYLRTVVGRDGQPAAGAELYFMVGANMALRRELITRLGGFDESIPFGGEEELFFRRARGAKFVYEPAALVAHRFDPRLRDVMRRARAYGRGHRQAARIHRDMRAIVYPFPPAVVAATVLWRRKYFGALLPLIAYPRWPLQAWQTSSLTPLLCAYLQLGEEIATMIGQVEGSRGDAQAAARSSRL